MKRLLIIVTILTSILIIINLLTMINLMLDLRYIFDPFERGDDLLELKKITVERIRSVLAIIGVNTLSYILIIIIFISLFLRKKPPSRPRL